MNRVESTIKPTKDFELEVKGNLCEVVFFDDIQKTTKKRMDDEESEEETLYTYKTYKLETIYRDGLSDEIQEHIEVWLSFAKSKDYDAKAAEIREIRNKLLSDSDKEMVLDRLGLDIPSNITATNMLSSIKTFFTGITSIVSGDMAKYRQALRDITKQDGFPYDVKFPDKPE